jgi:hypothetical protein
MVDRVFQKDPTARQIPLSHRSHIIGFQPLANGTAAHESTLERDFVTLTSFADPTAIIVSQPITLHCEDGPTRRRYTPDFLVRGTGVLYGALIEVIMAVIMRVSKLPHRTRSDVRAAATELGYSCAQVYRWLKRYAQDPRLTSLLPRKRGPAPGLLRLATQINETVADLLKAKHGGVVEIDGLGPFTWQQIVALADVLLGAVIAIEMLRRGLSQERNRLSHHLTPSWPGHPWSPGMEWPTSKY